MYTCPRPNCDALFRSEDAPAERVNNCWKFLVASGSSVMVLLLSDSPVVASVVSTWATWDSTCTTSLTDVTFSDAVRRVVSVMFTTTAGNLVVANPEALTSTR